MACWIRSSRVPARSPPRKHALITTAQLYIHGRKQCFHVGEMPEHGTDADSGPFRHRLRRGLEDAFVDQVMQGIDDQLPAALGAQQASIGLLIAG